MPRAAWKSRCPPVSAHSEFRIAHSRFGSEIRVSGIEESSPSVLTEWVVHLWVTESLPGGTWRRLPTPHLRGALLGVRVNIRGDCASRSRSASGTYLIPASPELGHESRWDAAQ